MAESPSTGSIENDENDFFDDMQWVQGANSFIDDTTDNEFLPSNTLSNANDDVVSTLTPINLSNQNTSQLLQSAVQAISKSFSDGDCQFEDIKVSPQLPLQLLTYEADIIKNNRYAVY